MPETEVAQPVAPVAPRWGLGDAILGFVLSILGGSLTFSLVLAITGDEADELDLSWLNIAQTGMWAVMIGVPVWAAATKGNGIVRDFGLRIRSMDVPLGALVGVLSQAVMLPLIYLPIFLLSDVDDNELSEKAKDLADRADGAFGVAMLVLLTGVAAPIIEEIFWRGLLLRALERRWGQTAAVVISGVAFGLAHFILIQIPGLAAFGVVLGVLAVRTGRLGAPIAAHMAFNLVAVASILMET